MKIALPDRPRRRMNLTPLIDVVFLLLVFFMMVSRFGTEQGVALSLARPGGAVEWSGPPRLIDITGQGLALNGQAVQPAALLAALVPLMAAPTDPVVLRAGDGADMQDLLALIDRLGAAGIIRLAVVP
jgi:biopolymer transport protein ExbD